jgi:hypothetical protein
MIAETEFQSPSSATLSLPGGVPATLISEIAEMSSHAMALISSRSITEEVKEPIPSTRDLSLSLIS